MTCPINRFTKRQPRPVDNRAWLSRQLDLSRSFDHRIEMVAKEFGLEIEFQGKYLAHVYPKTWRMHLHFSFTAFKQMGLQFHER